MNIGDITYCLDFADVRNLFKLYSFVDWDLCLLIATESWNGRGWKRYLESYGPSLLQRDNPEQGAQAHIQAASGDLQGDPTVSGHLVSGLWDLHSKNAFPVQREPLVRLLTGRVR